MQFKKKVIEIVKKIPRGKIATYEEVAILSGKPKVYRVVGNILNNHYRQNSPSSRFPHLRRGHSNQEIPCHRVIKSNGEIGNYALGRKKKEELLKKEGIKIKKHIVFLK